MTPVTTVKSHQFTDSGRKCKWPLRQFSNDQDFQQKLSVHIDILKYSFDWISGCLKNFAFPCGSNGSATIKKSLWIKCNIFLVWQTRLNQSPIRHSLSQSSAATSFQDQQPLMMPTSKYLYEWECFVGKESTAEDQGRERAVTVRLN